MSDNNDGENVKRGFNKAYTPPAKPKLPPVSETGGGTADLILRC